jgi:ferredoxin-thioredoxin reductase catalytic subunit
MDFPKRNAVYNSQKCLIRHKFSEELQRCIVGECDYTQIINEEGECQYCPLYWKPSEGFCVNYIQFFDGRYRKKYNGYT